MAVQYFLGAHHPGWLAVTDHSLFVSHRRLRGLRRLPRARAPWALDSGAFTEVSDCGRFQTSAVEYAAAVRRYSSEIGQLLFASPQDWMCEPAVRAVTNFSVRAHQTRTIDNYIELMSIDPTLPWVPVVQGWGLTEYWRHVEQYEARGIHLDQLPRVGVGSVCRRKTGRPGASASMIVYSLAAGWGLKLHGYGIAADELSKCGGMLLSADSMAWSAAARYEKLGEQNSLLRAKRWRAERVEPHLLAGFCPYTGGSLRGYPSTPEPARPSRRRTQLARPQLAFDFVQSGI
jgi:hypothetical protein